MFLFSINTLVHRLMLMIKIDLSDMINLFFKRGIWFIRKTEMYWDLATCPFLFDFIWDFQKSFLMLRYISMSTRWFDFMKYNNYIKSNVCKFTSFARKKEERATCSKHCSHACFYRKFTHSSHVNLHVWFFLRSSIQCSPLSLSLSFSLNIFFLFQHSALPTHVRFDMFRIGLWSIW